ncbi:hypothetical protein A2973_02510 [Candidatus Gottesmanbacteria bacterium RIFCSPLOWO2_01_FULL_49_10]|uniref:Ferric oxidoreductase domain-containing protein n=1 Tax=Candidatus Gottesmanbacteria bacterium RIFCSPLOWO2_01_FULL_49_10 TaxID=1798396 RepID=A0A1F6AZI0_9BACT|nr:MAG: hypothetical protein A2973_02510 [Candidatus Gottesmanbacteria bacterium RIFCSPLOWO2_01_FULL_49_10]
MARKKQPRVVSTGSGENIRQYAVAVGVVIVTVLGLRHYTIAAGSTGLSSLNQSLAASTLVLLGVVLLLGPLARLYGIFDGFLKYRKELGVMTFFTGAAHVYLVMFPLARRGPFGFYLAQPVSAYAGLTGLVIMFILLVLSVSVVERAIGTRVWWKLQYWGARLAFVAIVLHALVLKYAGWGRWISQRMGLPPLGFLAGVFAAFVLVVRISEVFGSRPARTVTAASFLTAVVFTAWVFM